MKMIMRFPKLSVSILFFACGEMFLFDRIPRLRNSFFRYLEEEKRL